MLAMTGSIILLQSLPAAAQSEDNRKWVAQCMRQNEDEGARTDVVRKYRNGVKDKMIDYETCSITQHKQANPKAWQ